MAPTSKVEQLTQEAKDAKARVDAALARINERKNGGRKRGGPESTASLVAAQHKAERKLDQAFEDLRGELARASTRTDEVLRVQKSMLDGQVRQGRKLGRLLHGQQSMDMALRGGGDSPGRKFGRSAQLKSWLSIKAGLGAPVQVGSFHRHAMKATPLSTDAATNLSEPDRRGIESLIETPQRRLRIRDLLQSVRTNKGSFEYFREIGFMAASRGSMTSITSSGTTATATTAVAHGLKTGDRVSIRDAVESKYNGEEIKVTVTGAQTFTYTVVSAGATSATGTITWVNIRTHGAPAFVAEGAAKPEAEFTLERKTGIIMKIAQFIKVTDETLDDIPRMEGLIDNKLTYGLKYKEDRALLYGSGSGEILGLLVDPARQQYAWSDGEVTDNKGDAIRRAAGVLSIAEYEATGAVMHPIDWEDIELLKDQQGRYIYIPIQNNDGSIGPRFWRLPVVETPSIAQGTALVGAFAIAATLYDREDASVRIGEEQDDMTKNKKTILAEERLGLAIERPESFVEVTFDSQPS